MLSVRTTSGEKFFIFILPQSAPSTLGVSTWALGDAAKGQGMSGKTLAFGYCAVLTGDGLRIVCTNGCGCLVNTSREEIMNFLTD